MILVLAACGTPAVDDDPTTTTTPTTSPTTTLPGPGGELAAARAAWAAAGLDTYHFTFQDDCGECLPEWATPKLAVVWDGALVGRAGLGVDALFDVIESALGGGRSVEVVYHPELGYPTDIWIDREDRAHDGGTHLLVQGLEPGLPGSEVTLAGLDAANDLWTRTRPPAYEFRTDFVCECPIDATLWTLVDGQRIADWRIEWARDEAAVDVSPQTIDQVFNDLRHLLAEGEVVEGGARITGGASYHPEFGYPAWIGLNIEVLDPDSPMGDLPPRLVIAIRDVVEHDLAGSAFARARERWSQVGPSDYSYELTEHDIEEGTFGPPHVVVVEADRVRSVTLDGTEVHPDNVPAYTIEDLFDMIETWESAGHRVETVFDERLGHPVLVIAHHGEEITAFSIEALRPR
ncbi:MAG TPA: DUF6174 domain-containing protein [Acidimicrobiia bacterium]|nr:DUF6174 domain-containing protein [Acidimicrobiia bacterium]